MMFLCSGSAYWADSFVCQHAAAALTAKMYTCIGGLWLIASFRYSPNHCLTVSCGLLNACIASIVRVAALISSMRYRAVGGISDMLRHRSAAESHRVTILWIKCGRSIWSLSESWVFIHLLIHDIMPENRLCVVLRNAVRLCRWHGRIARHLTTVGIKKFSDKHCKTGTAS